MGWRFLWALLAVAFCAGCGGENLFDVGGAKYTGTATEGTFGNNTPPQAPPPASPFVGVFVGTWTSPGDAGTAEFDFAANGAFTGTFHDDQRNPTRPVDGSITSAGALYALVGSGASVLALTGTLTLSSGRLNGSLTETDDAAPRQLSFNLAKQ